MMIFMAADLHIHVLEGITEKEIILFNKGSATVTSQLFDKIGESPNVWIGEVSWLKAALFNDSNEWIPSTVQTIRDLVGNDFPVIDEDFINKVSEAFDKQNITSYSLAEKQEVKDFLKEHLGKKAFTVSW
jgi:hypothetical protein